MGSRPPAASPASRCCRRRTSAAPRVDVTWRISGLFRDLFPAQIALIDAAVSAVAARDEADGDNPLAAVRRPQRQRPRRSRASSARRPAPTAPASKTCSARGSRIATSIGAAYLAATSHAYGGADGDGDGSARRLRASAWRRPTSWSMPATIPAATCSKVGRRRLHRRLCGRAAALGRSADLIVLDTTDPQRPRARSLGEALARIVRARAVNPRFIAGQMRHGPRGAAEFAETVDRLVGFAETTTRCRAR